MARSHVAARWWQVTGMQCSLVKAQVQQCSGGVDPLDANTACRGKDALSMLPDAQNVKDLEQVQGSNFSSSKHQTACPNLEILGRLNIVEYVRIIISDCIRLCQIISDCLAVFRALAMFSFPSQASLVVNELVAVRDSAKAPSKTMGSMGLMGSMGG